MRISYWSSDVCSSDLMAFPENTIPIVIQQKTGAFDCRMVSAEMLKALLRVGPVLRRKAEACPRDGGAHDIVPERPYRSISICVRYTGTGHGIDQQFEATEHVLSEHLARQQRCCQRLVWAPVV